uniref:Uncharacterized protein n=1 Tax=Panagrolaimus superbus TaxID=310955 RepID=A0A914YXL5_9BILA
MSEGSIAFCVLLEGLADAPEYSAQDVSDFYDGASQFALLMQSNGEKPEFTDAEKEAIQQSFPKAIQRAAEFTNELAQNKSLDELRDLLSKIEVVTKDLFEIYEIASNGEISSDVTESIQKLQSEHENIQQQLE